MKYLLHLIYKILLKKYRLIIFLKDNYQMSIINFNKIQKILYFFVLIFPLIIVLRSAAINTTLAIISAISILYILIKKIIFFEDSFVKFIIIFFWLYFYKLYNSIQ